MPNLTKKGWPEKGWSLRAIHLVFSGSTVWTSANPNTLTKLSCGHGKMPKLRGRFWSFLVLWVLNYSTFTVLSNMANIMFFVEFHLEITMKAFKTWSERSPKKSFLSISICHCSLVLLWIDWKFLYLKSPNVYVFCLRLTFSSQDFHFKALQPKVKYI